ncbi:MAG: potassium transporter TrkG, partial [Planctomycetaceae bacterium]
RVRLTLTTRLAASTTVLLLVAGTLGYYLLESTSNATKPENDSPLAEAWFQAVTFRTAGFNTVDHGDLQPATKLFAIFLMFVGASPGSTGGGVKTVCFAVTALALLSILRGRDRVEIAGRTIPQELVNRALAIVWLGIAMVMAATLLLTLFEGDGQNGRFLDHLFEATSAFATVGVSTGITPELSSASRLVIIVTMFVGRVGPLTVLIALAGRQRTARYDYPVERVTLG